MTLSLRKRLTILQGLSLSHPNKQSSEGSGRQPLVMFYFHPEVADYIMHKVHPDGCAQGFEIDKRKIILDTPRKIAH